MSEILLDKFIDIFKLSDQEGSSDAKLLGKWFVTNVHHVFKKDKYQNVIMCVQCLFKKITKDL